MKTRIFKRSVWAIATLFFAILMTIFIVLQGAVVPYERWIDNFFGVRRTFLVNDEGGEEKDTEYFKSKYPIDLEGHKKMQKEALEVTERVNEEGIVLLWNKNDALPLDTSKEKNISTFGVQSLSHDDGTGKIVDLWPYHGTGSANVDLRQDVGILNEEGLDVGPRLTKSLQEHGFLCNQADAGILFVENRIQMLEKFDSFQVLISAVTVGDPLTILASIVQIEHGGYGIYPQAVHMEFFYPVDGIAD